MAGDAFGASGLVCLVDSERVFEKPSACVMLWMESFISVAHSRLFSDKFVKLLMDRTCSVVSLLLCLLGGWVGV